MNSEIEEYVLKIGRITSEYKLLSRREVEGFDEDESEEQVKARKLEIYKYIKRKAVKCESEDIALATLEFTPKMFKYLPAKIKGNESFFKEAVDYLESAKIFKYADSSIRNNLDCALLALKYDLNLYKYVGSSIKDHFEILEYYEWKKELNDLPKNLPDIDLEAWGPDDDDKYFTGVETITESKDEKASDEFNEAEEVEKLHLDSETEQDLIGDEQTLDLETTISKPSQEKNNPNITKSLKQKKDVRPAPDIIEDLTESTVDDEATIDWAADHDEDFDDEETGEGSYAKDDDPELPPNKNKKRKKWLGLF